MNYKLLFSFLFFIGFAFTSCVDLEFDEPPQYDPNEHFDACIQEVNTTIADLKAIYTVGSDPLLIVDDLIIEGIINGDDKSGAFYKVLIFQDETAGIEMRVNMTDMYNLYPVGSNIFVQCQGLYLGNYNGNVQIGLLESSDQTIARIPETLMADYICRGETVNELVARQVSIGQINNSMQNTLLQIDNVEFDDGDRGQPYAINETTTNRTVVDCSGAEILLRTSNFSSFANDLTPVGNGSITAVYTDFGTTKQLYIRDAADVDMTAALCDGGGPIVGTDLEPNITIAALKDLYTIGSGQIEITDDYIIEGNVISSDVTGNFFKQLIIQDGSGGIEIRIDEYDLYESYAVGQKVYVECNGLYLGDYNGSVQLGIDDGEGGINRIPDGEKGNFITIGTTLNLVSPTIITIDELNNSHQNTLVQLKDVQFIAEHRGVTYADGENNISLNLNIEDCDDASLVLRSSGYSDFVNQLTPSDNGTITAIFTVFQTTKQLFVRDLNDIAFFNELCDGGGGGGGNDDPVDALSEDFEGQQDYSDVNLSGWQNVAVQGPRLWQARLYDNNMYAQATAYVGSSEPFNTMESWLISPTINLDAASMLNFDSAMAFFDHNAMSVWISTDYDGNDINGGNWQELSANLANSSSEDNAWVNSGDVDLSNWDGVGYIGFKYEGNGSDDNAQTTFRFDNVVIE